MRGLASILWRRLVGCNTLGAAQHVNPHRVVVGVGGLWRGRSGHSRGLIDYIATPKASPLLGVGGDTPNNDCALRSAQRPRGMPCNQGWGGGCAGGGGGVGGDRRG